MKLTIILVDLVLTAIVAAQKQQKRIIFVPLGSNFSTGKHFSLQISACLKGKEECKIKYR